MIGKAPSIFRGDTWTRAWRLQAADGSPLNLTGASARLHVRDENDALIAECSSANGRLSKA